MGAAGTAHSSAIPARPQAVCRAARGRECDCVRTQEWMPLAHAARIPYPAWQTVYYNFRRWEREGVWDRILHTLRMRMRTRQGRDEEPSAAVIDSQSIKTSAVRGPEKGYDAGKKNLGPQAPRAGGHARQPAGGEGDRSREIRSPGRSCLTHASQTAVSPYEARLG
jgi:transposase